MNTLRPFLLEEFMKEYEFTAPYMLCSSVAESWSLKEILEMADPELHERWHTLSLEYTEPAGMPLLRHEISSLYTCIDSDHISTFAGAEEGIYCTMRTLIKPNDHVIVVTPCYQSLLTLPQDLGADVTRLPLLRELNWNIDPDMLKKAFRRNTKLVVLNIPHNPTGSLIDKEVFDLLISLARHCGSYIFSDEVYRFLEVDETTRTPSIADAYERGITLNVMSKSFGLPGLRIGWLASQDTDLTHAVGSYKLYTSICNSAPSELLSLMALGKRDYILKRNRTVMLNNIALLDNFMERNEKHLSWIRPRSGSMATIELKGRGPVESFVKELVTKTGVLLLPASVFGLQGNFFRIGFGKKTMAEILPRLEEFLCKS